MNTRLIARPLRSLFAKLLYIMLIICKMIVGNGIRNKNCQPCWDDEDKNVYSLREKINTVPSRQESAIAAIKAIKDDGHIETNPTWLELKTSNVCNLKCRMCHPMDSTSWSQDYTNSNP